MAQSVSNAKTVAELLGIERQVSALRAMEAGDVSQGRFDELSDRWGIDAWCRMSHGGGLERIDEPLAGLQPNV